VLQKDENHSDDVFGLQGLGSKILTVVAIVMSLLLLVFVATTWGLIWGQPKAMRSAAGVSDSYCQKWNSTVRFVSSLFSIPPRKLVMGQ